MKSVVTIKGQPIIEIYESFDGSYWFVTERAWKQDSLIGRSSVITRSPIKPKALKMTLGDHSNVGIL